MKPDNLTESGLFRILNSTPFSLGGLPEGTPEGTRNAFNLLRASMDNYGVVVLGDIKDTIKGCQVGIDEFVDYMLERESKLRGRVLPSYADLKDPEQEVMPILTHPTTPKKLNSFLNKLLDISHAIPTYCDKLLHVEGIGEVHFNDIPGIGEKLIKDDEADDTPTSLLYAAIATDFASRDMRIGQFYKEKCIFQVNPQDIQNISNIQEFNTVGPILARIYDFQGNKDIPAGLLSKFLEKQSTERRQSNIS